MFNAYANDSIVADFKFGSCPDAVARTVVEHGERVVTERKGIVARHKGFGAIGVEIDVLINPIGQHTGKAHIGLPPATPVHVGRINAGRYAETAVERQHIGKGCRLTKAYFFRGVLAQPGTDAERKLGVQPFVQPPPRTVDARSKGGTAIEAVATDFNGHLPGQGFDNQTVGKRQGRVAQAVERTSWQCVGVHKGIVEIALLRLAAALRGHREQTAGEKYDEKKMLHDAEEKGS